MRNRGAGIYGPADIIGNLIADNEGSSIHFEWASDRLVSGNRITGNVAPYDGGRDLLPLLHGAEQRDPLEQPRAGGTPDLGGGAIRIPRT